MDSSRSRSSWDFTLMMLTVAALAALGVQSFVGTAVAWWGERNDPFWQTSGYAGFVEVMNAIAGPIVIALVVLLGLCIPRRILERRALAIASGALLLVGIVAWIVARDPAAGLGWYLIAAGAFQVVVLVMTFGDAPSLSYMTEGRLVRLGSGLLHLGFIVFAYVVVALQQSPWMLPVFWISSGLLVAGSTMSFYARPLVGRRPSTATSGADEPDDS